MRSGSVKKILGLLEKLAKKEPEQYQEFWDQFGKAMKEGPVEDMPNREQIMKLLRFSSSVDGSEKQTVSLTDYVARMKEGQEKIFYITADNFNAAKNSPHLEIFMKKGIEVLLMADRVDEWMMGHVMEFDGKSLQSVAKGELDLGKIKTDDKDDEKKDSKQSKKLIGRIKKVLDSKVEDVRVSERLTQSPSCIVLNEHEMAMYMQQLLKQAGQDTPSGKPVLEINPEHPILKQMEAEKDGDRFNDWSELLLDQAILAEGGQLDEPATFVKRMNEIMLTLSN